MILALLPVFAVSAQAADRRMNRVVVNGHALGAVINISLPVSFATELSNRF